MKRSEMRHKIKSIIATCGPTQPTIITAEQVLQACENAGMKPPGVWVNEHIYDRTSGMHGWEEFEWEAESTCIDCGAETAPGPGSARCPACWEDKLGESV